jgi:protein CpxP
MMQTMTVKTSVRLAAAALAITVGLAGAAQAQPGPGARGFGDGMGPGHGGPGGRMGGPLGGLLAVHPELPLHALNLTDAQREQVRTIMQAHRDEARALGDKAHTALDALRKATEGTVDEALANQQGQALGAVIGEAAVLRAKVRAEVLAILTPEQQAEANKLQAQRQQRMDQMKQRGEQRRKSPPPDQF